MPTWLSQTPLSLMETFFKQFEGDFMDHMLMTWKHELMKDIRFIEWFGSTS